MGGWVNNEGSASWKDGGKSCLCMTYHRVGNANKGLGNGRGGGGGTENCFGRGNSHTEKARN